MSKHSHYKKDVSHLTFIDPYRIADLYGMNGGPIEHAFKKVLCAGQRGAKDKARDVQDAIDSLLRWQEMQAEDAGWTPETIKASAVTELSTCLYSGQGGVMIRCPGCEGDCGCLA